MSERPCSLGRAQERPVRICYVIDRLGLGGTETQLLGLIAGLDRARFVPYMCLLDGEDEESRSLEPQHCRVIRLSLRSLHHPLTLCRAWRLASFLRREQIDIVQTHFPDSTYFAAPIARMAGVRHVLRTRRDLGFWMRPLDRFLGRLYGLLVTATLANCQASRQAVIEQERAAPESVVVLENGIDLEPFLRIALPGTVCTAQAGRVGMVANLRPVKGPDVLIRAAVILAPRFPQVSFCLAGSGDELSARRWIHSSGLQGRFELLGSVKDVPALLGELHVAVLASRSEGLSNALIEYMAAGRPIVATAVGGNPELIEDGVHGLLVPPDDPAALAAAVARLLEDRPLAARLAAAARQRACQRFSRNAMVARYQQFYLNLLQRT